MKHVTIYTDGACSGNPGPGGWGAVLIYNEHQTTISGSEPDTTNNRMELTAAIEAIKALTQPCMVDIYTDSIYVQQGITSWIINWRNNDWRNKRKQAIKNVDLWQELDQCIAKHQVNWHWVKGHAGNEFNELADKLATDAIQALY